MLKQIDTYHKQEKHYHFSKEAKEYLKQECDNMSANVKNNFFSDDAWGIAAKHMTKIFRLSGVLHILDHFAAQNYRHTATAAEDNSNMATASEDNRHTAAVPEDNSNTAPSAEDNSNTTPSAEIGLNSVKRAAALTEYSDKVFTVLKDSLAG